MELSVYREADSWLSIEESASIPWNAKLHISLFRGAHLFSVTWATLILSTTSHSLSLKPILILYSKYV